MTSRRKKKVVSAAPAVKSRFNPGEFAAVTHYVKVTNVGADQITVEDVNLKNMKFDIKGKELLDNAKSASHFTETKKVSRTELATMLSTCYNTPFTINFDKADGQNRTLVGKLVEPEPILGRSKVFDFEEPTVAWKQADHRTLHWMIVNGVKYQVK